MASIFLPAIAVAIISAADGQHWCGQSSFNPASGYVVGGTQAQHGWFPWTVGLVNSYDYLYCGGSYVWDMYGSIKVITAAHCISNASDVYNHRAVFGMVNTHTDYHQSIILTPRSIQIHPGYDNTYLNYDVAILDFGGLSPQNLDGVDAHPVCLPSRAYTDWEPAIVTGWGTTAIDEDMSDHLLYATKLVFTRDHCLSTGLGIYHATFDNSMLCAGEEGKDACHGDSGGPLVAMRNGNWELVGIVSWGLGCGDPNYPGVYADVDHAMDWIVSQMI